MKSKVMLSGIAALLVSASGASAIELHPFVGASMGLQGVFYSDSTKDAETAYGFDLPDSLFTFGINGGIRFGNHTRIYNGGLSLNLDMSTDTDVKEKFSDTKIADMHTNVFSATYDNYIRISGDKSSRIDLVLGAGLGSMSYTFDDSTEETTEHSMIVVLKAGLDFALTKEFTLSATSRLLLPTKSDYVADSSYIVGGGVKYVF